ncbi:MAG: hypothetical protein JRH11_18815, partial [Deltaproteobacteria bacterium]|nr:hypothetical protein [Deltaproteobacteria bacterium]
MTRRLRSQPFLITQVTALVLLASCVSLASWAFVEPTAAQDVQDVQDAPDASEAAPPAELPDVPPPPPATPPAVPPAPSAAPPATDSPSRIAGNE